MLMVYELPRDTAPPDNQLTTEARELWDASMRSINQRHLLEMARRMRIEWPRVDEQEMTRLHDTWRTRVDLMAELRSAV